VVDYKTLTELIDRYPGGILVDDELTNFTYKEVQTNIDKALKDKRVKKIANNNPKDEHYFLFPRTIEMEYELRHENYKQDFSMNEYLEICSHLNEVEKSEESKTVNARDPTGDLNYKLPGYLEEKEKWLKHNLKK
jgi:hypothetical protein